MDRNNHSNDNKNDLIKKNNYITKHLSYHQKNRFFRIFSDNFYLLDTQINVLLFDQQSLV